VVKVTVYAREGCPWCDLLLEALDRYSYLFTDVDFEVVLETGSDFGPLLRHVAVKRSRRPYPAEEVFYREALKRGVPPERALETALRGAAAPQLVVEAKAPNGEERKIVVIGSAATPEMADSLVLNLRKLINALSL